MDGKHEVNSKQVLVPNVAEQMRTGLVKIHDHLSRQVGIVAEAENALKSGIVIVKEKKYWWIIKSEARPFFNEDTLSKIEEAISRLPSAHDEMQLIMLDLENVLREGDTFLIGQHEKSQRDAERISRELVASQNDQRSAIFEFLAHLAEDNGKIEEFDSQTHVSEYLEKLTTLRRAYQIDITEWAKKNPERDFFSVVREWNHMVDRVSELKSVIETIVLVRDLQSTKQFLHERLRSYGEWSAQLPNYLEILKTIATVLRPYCSNLSPNTPLTSERSETLNNIGARLKDEHLPKLEHTSESLRGFDTSEDLLHLPKLEHASKLLEEPDP